MRYWVVTCLAFASLAVSTYAAAAPDSPTWTVVWCVGLVFTAVLFPYWGFLLGRRSRR